jgi:hypothetical protein
MAAFVGGEPEIAKPSVEEFAVAAAQSAMTDTERTKRRRN